MMIIPYIKKSIWLQAIGLMDLKVKANGSHDFLAKVFE